jgi:tetratricopeptide (TPR) repeat protein
MQFKATKENYRKWIPRLEAEIDRARRSGVDREMVLADSIGNMHWEFGDFHEARLQYERAIACARNQSARPLAAVAWLYWKAGRPADAERECRGLIADLERELPKLDTPVSGSSEEGRRKLMMVYWNLANAGFMLGEYAEVEQWGKKAKDLLGRSAATTAESVCDMAAGLRINAVEAFARGLRSLRGVTAWPTFESSSNADLYRFALALSRERFGGIPADLAGELLSPEGGESKEFISALRQSPGADAG